jgi:hypothetical protein
MRNIRIVRTTQILFSLNAAIWVIFGILSLVNIENNSTAPRVVLWVIAILMFGNAGALALSGYTLSNRVRWSYYLCMVVLGINIILTVTDQVGTLDWITLAIDILLLSLLMMIRKEYL